MDLWMASVPGRYVHDNYNPRNPRLYRRRLYDP